MNPINKDIILTADRLREVVDYNVTTGVFTWKIISKYRLAISSVGDIAGCLNRGGYYKIGIDNHVYLAHRLAFLYMTGEWPKHQIDHINRVTHDNRWVNLREATHAQNIRNSKIKSTNTAGFKGIRKNNKGWIARIWVNGKRLYLGQFSSREEAHTSYVTAAIEHFGEYARAA